MSARSQAAVDEKAVGSLCKSRGDSVGLADTSLIDKFSAMSISSDPAGSTYRQQRHRPTGANTTTVVRSAASDCGVSGSSTGTAPSPAFQNGVASAALYHGTWPTGIGGGGSGGGGSVWRSDPSTVMMAGPDVESLSDQDHRSVMSFASSSGGAPLDRVLQSAGSTGSPASDRQQQLDAKVDMVYSLLTMLGDQDHTDMGDTLLALSSSPISCQAMRKAGCIPLLVQLVISDRDAETRNKASQALHNLVYSHSDEKTQKRERRVLKLLDNTRIFIETVKDRTFGRSKPLPIDDLYEEEVQHVAHLMKLSFDDSYRRAISQLGGIHIIARLVEMEHGVNGNSISEIHISLLRFACMALINLTFGESGNKTLLCSFREFMRSLVVQLQSENDELRQVTASVLRNLSWRADNTSKEILREVGTVTGLMKVAIQRPNREPTLKAILSALWNLSGHSIENKSEICAVEGALGFLVDMLKPPSVSSAADTTTTTGISAPVQAAETGGDVTRTPAIIENAGGILRNVSNQIAMRDDYREILREHNCLQVLVEQLKYPSLTVVSNACGTLWNLSAKNARDQDTLRQLGALQMLGILTKSKHKTIATASSAALKNLDGGRLGSAAAATGGSSTISGSVVSKLLFQPLDSTTQSMALPALPTLNVRKQRALIAAEIDPSLAETFEAIDSTGKHHAVLQQQMQMPQQQIQQLAASTAQAGLFLKKGSSGAGSTVSNTSAGVHSQHGEVSTTASENNSKERCDERSTSDIYAETDLDQPTDYSLRYAEDDSSDDGMPSVGTPTEPAMSVATQPPSSTGSKRVAATTETEPPADDTVQTYCTEGTPYNFSTATSISDLTRLPSQAAAHHRHLDDDETCSTPDKSNTVAVAAASGLASPEKPIPYCEEGTPGYFSRGSSFGSLDDAADASKRNNCASDNCRTPPRQGVSNADQHVITDAMGGGGLGQRQPAVGCENPSKTPRAAAMGIVVTVGGDGTMSGGSGVRQRTPEDRKISTDNKSVKFDQSLNCAQETPLMFSRSSSLASLDSVEQHSIHDDRSSVISDFSRLTSGIASPSEIPDSPTQTVPPSPRPQKSLATPRMATAGGGSGSVRRFGFATPLGVRSIFEDNMIRYKEESTPAQFSSATSLSSLAIDDHEAIVGDIKSGDLKSPGVSKENCISSSELPEQHSNADARPSVAKPSVVAPVADRLTRGKSSATDYLSDSSNASGEYDPSILDDCIKAGMTATSKKHTGTSFSVSQSTPKSAVSHLPDQLNSQHPQQLPRFVNSARGNLLLPDHSIVDALTTYCTEDTPAILSHAGSSSDLSSLLSHIPALDDSLPVITSIGGVEGLVTEPPIASPAVAGKQLNADYLSDSSSNMSSEYSRSLLAECIKAGMPSKKGPSSQPRPIPQSATKALDNARNEYPANSSLSSCDSDDELLRQCIISGMPKPINKDLNRPQSAGSTATRIEAIVQQDDALYANRPHMEISSKKPPKNAATTSPSLNQSRQTAVDGNIGISNNNSVAVANGITAGYLSDSSSNMSGEDQNLLAECIKAGMRAVTGQSASSRKPVVNDACNPHPAKDSFGFETKAFTNTSTPLNQPRRFMKAASCNSGALINKQSATGAIPNVDYLSDSSTNLSGEFEQNILTDCIEAGMRAVAGHNVSSKNANNRSSSANALSSLGTETKPPINLTGPPPINQQRRSVNVAGFNNSPNNNAIAGAKSNLDYLSDSSSNNEFDQNILSDCIKAGMRAVTGAPLRSLSQNVTANNQYAADDSLSSESDDALLQQCILAGMPKPKGNKTHHIASRKMQAHAHIGNATVATSSVPTMPVLQQNHQPHHRATIAPPLPPKNGPAPSAGTRQQQPPLHQSTLCNSYPIVTSNNTCAADGRNTTNSITNTENCNITDKHKCIPDNTTLTSANSTTCTTIITTPIRNPSNITTTIESRLSQLEVQATLDPHPQLVERDRQQAVWEGPAVEVAADSSAEDQVRWELGAAPPSPTRPSSGSRARTTSSSGVGGICGDDFEDVSTTNTSTSTCSTLATTVPDHRMLDPDAMIESLDRFTAQLVQQSSLYRSTNTQSSSATWHEDEDEIDQPSQQATFPTLSDSVPQVITFEPSDTKPAALTESALIQLEAAKLATALSAQTASLTSLELDEVQPPSHLNSLLLDTTGGSPPLTRKKSLPTSALLRRRVVALADSSTRVRSNSTSNLLPHRSNRIENQQNKQQQQYLRLHSDTSLPLGGVDPPQNTSGAHLQQADLESSMQSVASIASEEASLSSLLLLPRPDLFKRLDGSACNVGADSISGSDLVNPIFSLKAPFLANSTGLSLSVTELENVNPPSLLFGDCGGLTSYCSDSLADVATEFEDCCTHVVGTLQTLPHDIEDSTEYSDAHSVTPLPSDELVQSNATSNEASPCHTPVKQESPKRNTITPRQRRNMVADRFKTHVIEPDVFLLQQQQEFATLNGCHTADIESTAAVSRENNQAASIPSSSSSSPQSPQVARVSARERRQNNPSRFKTQTLKQPVVPQQTATVQGPPSQAPLECDAVDPELKYRTYSRSSVTPAILSRLSSENDDCGSLVDPSAMPEIDISSDQQQLGAVAVALSPPIGVVKPKIVKPSTASVAINGASAATSSSSAVEQPESSDEAAAKAIRGKRKPLYSKTTTTTANCAAPPTRHQHLPSGRSSANGVANKPPMRPPTVATSATNSRAMPNMLVKAKPAQPMLARQIHPNQNGLRSAPVGAPASVGIGDSALPKLDRQGTFTKPETSSKPPSVPTTSASTTTTGIVAPKSRIARAILPTTKLSIAPTHPSCGLTSALSSRPPASSTATASSIRPTSKSAQTSPRRTYDRSLSANGRVMTGVNAHQQPTQHHGMRTSNSVQSLRSAALAGPQTCNGTRNAAGGIGLHHNKVGIPNSSAIAMTSAAARAETASGTQPTAKQITSRIASLWKRVEDSKKQQPMKPLLKDRRIWLGADEGHDAEQSNSHTDAQRRAAVPGAAGAQSGIMFARSKTFDDDRIKLRPMHGGRLVGTALRYPGAGAASSAATAANHHNMRTAGDGHSGGEDGSAGGGPVMRGREREILASDAF